MSPVGSAPARYAQDLHTKDQRLGTPPPHITRIGTQGRQM